MSQPSQSLDFTATTGTKDATLQECLSEEEVAIRNGWEQLKTKLEENDAAILMLRDAKVVSGSALLDHLCQSWPLTSSREDQVARIHAESCRVGAQARRRKSGLDVRRGESGSLVRIRWHDGTGVGLLS